jgi:DNA-binding MarR family transcriptional regulator
MWALCRISRDGIVDGRELAERAGVPLLRGRPYVNRLVADGLVRRHPEEILTITDRGREVAGRLVEARRAGLARHLNGWNPEAHPELSELLARLAEESLGDDADAREVHHAGAGTLG